MAGVNIGGVGITKNVLSLTGGPGGTQAPPALADKRRGVSDQFQQKLSTIQLTIDHQKFGQLHPYVFEKTWKNKNFTQIDKNAKKHENRQNDVIFAV